MKSVAADTRHLQRGSFSAGELGSTDAARPRFSLVVPAHNEAARISPNVIGYAETFSDSEVIVVLNGCTDATEEIVVDIAVRYTNLTVIHIDHAVGKGGAVRAGFLAARAPIVGYVDADGATSPAEMRRLFELLDDNTDAVIGSRWTLDAKVETTQPFIRRFSSRIFNGIVRVLFGMKFHDTQCGAKVFRRAALREIGSALEISNFAFDIDLLYKLHLAKKRIIETPTVWRDISGSKVELTKTSREMLLAALRLRIRHSTFRYVIPIFDRFWPTRPLHARDQLAILFLNWRDPKHPQAGGAEKYLLEIGKRLVERGHVVHWLTAGFPGCAATETIDGIHITRVGDRISVYWQLPLAYARSFRDRFDILVDAENGIPFFSPLFSFKAKLCLVHHVHQRVFDRHLAFPLSTIFKFLEAKVMPALYRNVGFVAVSNDTKRELIELGVDSSHIDVVHNGVDPRSSIPTKAERPTILYVGRLKAYKRIQLILDAIVRIRARIPEVELIIAGTGDEAAALSQSCANLGIANHVRFEGFVSEERKDELMGEAWVFAMPSEMEGWGLTIIEANACGTPAVGFEVPGVREAIVHGSSGLLVADEAEFADALERILADTTLRKTLEDGARARASEFSWSRASKQFLDAMFRAMSKQHMSLIWNEDVWTVIPYRSRRAVKSLLSSLPKATRGV